MAEMILEPANDHVLVLDSLGITTLNGLDMPDNARQKEMVFGTVVAAGPLASSTHKDDRICYGPYAGKTVIMNEIEFRSLREGQIEAYIRERK
jgi:co-chaperonin GroES (HSP10)